ncbi:sugar transferase [Gaetbulibacter sp. M240]|uniref:sugar transferase n=1 Tax=Gaetbulibacter sp. M240 TaxID=3126511 RepID=UPI00374F0491
MIRYKHFKKLMDLTIALFAVIVLSPVIIMVSVLLFIMNHGQVFFFQDRIGKNEKPFRIIKFKTMTDKTDQNGQLLLDTYRLFPLGKMIRKSSIDELPQLFNVLKGDMSIIGPRPLLPEYLPFYSIKEQKRHHVHPGITGYAQVNGRNHIDWDTKLKLDAYYVEHLSFKLDFQILIKTVFKVIASKDVASDNTGIEKKLSDVRKKLNIIS